MYSVLLLIDIGVYGYHGGKSFNFYMWRDALMLLFRSNNDNKAFKSFSFKYIIIPNTFTWAMCIQFIDSSNGCYGNNNNNDNVSLTW